MSTIHESAGMLPRSSVRGLDIRVAFADRVAGVSTHGKERSQGEDLKPAGLKRALGCLFTTGFAAVPRGALWGLVVGLAAGAYCCFTLPYGGGIGAGPVMAVAGPVAGVWLAFHLGAAVGLHRAGYRWMILLVIALAAAVVLTPYGVYRDGQMREAEYRRLVLELENDDPAPFLAELRGGRSRGIVQDHLEQFLVCAGAHSRPEVVDALAALDPRGNEGYALCAAAQYPRPATVSHLLGEGFSPTRAHRLSGRPCEPLLELAEGSRATPPCSLSMLGDFDQLTGAPTADGCKHRVAVAALLIEAGASSDGGAPFGFDGCKDDGGRAPAESGAPGNESGAD